MKSGIYKITNLINNKFYIGSAIYFPKRFSRHKTDLIKNIHSNKKLQNSVNKHGLDNFKFEILVTCPPEYCIKLEQWFIDNLKPEYNLSPTAGNNLGSRYRRRSDLTEIQVKNILNDYKTLSIKDIAIKNNIKEVVVKGLIFKPLVAQDIKKEIGFELSKERKLIIGDNNKQQRFTKEQIEQIANLYNSGKQPKYIAIQLFNDEKLRYAIAKLAKGVSYKEYSYLFDSTISYHGKQKQN